MTNSDLIHLITKQSQLSIDDLETLLWEFADDLGYVKSSLLQINNPTYLHVEDALEILKWNALQRSFYGNTSIRTD